MKKIKIQYIIFAVLLCSLLSCKKDFLELTDKSTIPEENVFNNVELTRLFVNNMYLNIPVYWTPTDPTGLYDNIADESRSFWDWGESNVLYGQWNANDNPMEYWPYANIRKTNMFLGKIDAANFSEEDKSSLKGQVKALRAKLYFDMVKRYGGVPIITVAQTLQDSLLVPRQSTDSTFSFIVRELQEAVQLLPDSYGSRDEDVSRWNKNSAKAFLGRVLLYWASPLFNPNGDVSRWEKAAAINKEVIDAGVYSLHPDFRRIELDKNNEEEVLSVQFKFGFRENGYDSDAQPDDRSRGWAVVRSPVQEFVDAFEMKNGKGIYEAGSGYDPNHPYDNRDPRFKQTVITNGDIFPFWVDGVNLPKPIWMYEGREETGVASPYATVTGYLLRKGVDESNGRFDGWSGSEQNWIEIRYAEVLLNYAEAQNEAAGPGPSVYNAVEQIRQRAGLDPYQLPVGLSQEEMRQRIRHQERYIELSFENKRYWDIRRWKIATELLNGKQYNGMFITQADDNTPPSRYEIRPVDPTPIVFQDKMYLMPLPQSEIVKNPNLEQNPGW